MKGPFGFRVKLPLAYHTESSCRLFNRVGRPRWDVTFWPWYYRLFRYIQNYVGIFWECPNSDSFFSGFSADWSFGKFSVETARPDMQYPPSFPFSIWLTPHSWSLGWYTVLHQWFSIFFVTRLVFCISDNVIIGLNFSVLAQKCHHFYNVMRISVKTRLWLNITFIAMITITLRLCIEKYKFSTVARFGFFVHSEWGFFWFFKIKKTSDFFWKFFFFGFLKAETEQEWIILSLCFIIIIIIIIYFFCASTVKKSRNVLDTPDLNLVVVVFLFFFFWQS